MVRRSQKQGPELPRMQKARRTHSRQQRPRHTRHTLEPLRWRHGRTIGNGRTLTRRRALDCPCECTEVPNVGTSITSSRRHSTRAMACCGLTIRRFVDSANARLTNARKGRNGLRLMCGRSIDLLQGIFQESHSDNAMPWTRIAVFARRRTRA